MIFLDLALPLVVGSGENVSTPEKINGLSFGLYLREASIRPADKIYVSPVRKSAS